MEFILMVTVVFVLGITAVYAYFVIKKEFGLSQYVKKSKKKIDSHLENVIDSSELVLNDSTSKMKQLLRQTNHFKGEVESQAKSAFTEFKSKYADSLNSELANVEKQYEEEFYRNAVAVKEKLDARLEDQIARSDKLIEAFTKSEMERVTKEVEEFKNSQEEKSVQKLQKILTKVLEDVVTKTLSQEEQKKLIWSSLESIKKDSFSDK